MNSHPQFLACLLGLAGTATAATAPAAPQAPPIVYDDPSPVAVQAPPPPSAASVEVKARVDALIGEFPAFAQIIKNDPAFRGRWETRVRLARAMKPKFAALPTFVQSVGVGLLMDEVDPYLARSSDDDAIAYAGLLFEMMEMGSQSAVMCRIVTSSMGGSGELTKVDDADEAALEEQLRPGYHADMLAAIARVLRADRQAPARVLAETELTDMMMVVVTSMMDAHGDTVLTRLGQLEDPRAPAQQRCETMAWMFEAIRGLPVAARANVIRGMFTEEGRKAGKL